MTREMPVDEAKAMGATALFSEKYGSTVRVVNMGNYSIELCGGTHLDNTAKVGPFEIESECSVASGVRRIEAITGKACLERMERNQTMLLEAAAKLKTKPIELGTRRSWRNSGSCGAPSRPTRPRRPWARSTAFSSAPTMWTA